MEDHLKDAQPIMGQAHTNKQVATKIQRSKVMSKHKPNKGVDTGKQNEPVETKPEQPVNEQPVSTVEADNAPTETTNKPEREKGRDVSSTDSSSNVSSTASDDKGITDVPFETVGPQATDPVELPTGSIPPSEALVEQKPTAIDGIIMSENLAVPVFTGRGLTIVKYDKDQKFARAKFEESGLTKEDVKDLQDTLAEVDDAMSHLFGAAQDTGRYSFVIGKAAAHIVEKRYFTKFRRLNKEGNFCVTEKEFFDDYFSGFKYNRIRQLIRGWRHSEKMAPAFAIKSLPRYLGELHARYGEMYLFSPTYDWVEKNSLGGPIDRAQIATDLASEVEVESWQLSIEQAQDAARKAGKTEAEIAEVRPSADLLAENAPTAIKNVLSKHKQFANKNLFADDGGIKLPKMPAMVQKRQAAQRSLNEAENGETPEPAEVQPPRTRDSVYKDLSRMVLGLADNIRRWDKDRDVDNQGARPIQWDSMIAPFGRDKDQEAEFKSALEKTADFCKEMQASMAFYRAKHLKEVELQKAKEAAAKAETPVKEPETVTETVN